MSMNNSRDVASSGSVAGKLPYKKFLLLLISVVLSIVVFYILPAGDGGLGSNARLLSSLFVLALLLWATEVVPISVTSLLIIALGPFIRVFPSINAAAVGFTSPVIFYIIASFILSVAFQKAGLSRRLALWLIGKFGTDSKTILLVFMSGCAVVASFMSNVPACAIWMALLIPILNRNNAVPGKSNFGKAAMIGIPIASLTGGIATPAGSSTNILALSLLREIDNIDITFVQWMAVGIPLAVIITVFSWFVLVKIFPPEIDSIGDVETFKQEAVSLGAWSRKEITTVILIAVMITLWILSSWIKQINVTIVAIFGICVMFLPGINLIEWKDAKQGIGWDSVLIVGSVTSLGLAATKNGLSEWIVNTMLGGVVHMPLFPALLAICFFTIVLHLPLPVIPTIISAFVPAMVILAVDSGVNPAVYALAVALASHCAFLLPLDAVPLVTYSKGYYRMFDMFIPGSIISIAWAVVNAAVVYFISPLVGLS